MGQPELSSDPRYVDHLSRGSNQAVLDAIIERWTSGLTVVEVEALMLAHSVPAGAIYRAPEMLADPHFVAREALVAVETPRWGTVMMQNSFPKLSDTPGSICSPAPATVGQDNDSVLGDMLGLSTAERDALAAQGVI